MGYCFTIGELSYGGDDDGQVWLDAVVIEEAQALDIVAPLNTTHDHQNMILPSYSGWSDFMDFTGLGMHLRKLGIEIVRDHPGVCFISEGVKDAIVNYGKTWLEAHPVVERKHTKSVGYGYVEHLEFDCYHSARMRWLVWWVDWSYQHCKFPVISNG